MHFERLLAVCVAVLCLVTTPSQAQADSNYLSLGLRFAALIGQQRLASPPLPSLDPSQKHKFNLQAAYIGGKINGVESVVASDGAVVDVPIHQGYSRAYSGGLNYTSPSVGRFSFFAFGVYTQGSGNLHVNFAEVDLENNHLNGLTVAAGGNYVFIGDPESVFKMGLFGGMFLSKASSRYDYVQEVPQLNSPGRFATSANFTDFGPMAGLQAGIEWWLFAAKSFLMYAKDLTSSCTDLTISGSTQKCFVKLDSSLASYGVSLGFWKFGLTIYSHVWGHITNSDIAFKKYELSYTLSF